LAEEASDKAKQEKQKEVEPQVKPEEATTKKPVGAAEASGKKEE